MKLVKSVYYRSIIRVVSQFLIGGLLCGAQSFSDKSDKSVLRRLVFTFLGFK